MNVTNATFDGLLRLPVWVGLKDHELGNVIDSVNEILASLDIL